jgi:hypothetical protein
MLLSEQPVVGAALAQLQQSLSGAGAPCGSIQEREPATFLGHPFQRSKKEKGDFSKMTTN